MDRIESGDTKGSDERWHGSIGCVGDGADCQGDEEAGRVRLKLLALRVNHIVPESGFVSLMQR